MLNKLTFTALVIAVLGSAGFITYIFLQEEPAPPEEPAPLNAAMGEPTPTPLPTATPTPTLPGSASIIIDARVVPAESTDVRFGVDGIVSKVLVEEGDVVHAGQVLARLDMTDLQMQLTEAQLALEEAQLGIEQAQLAASQARANYAERVRHAEADVIRAQNQLLQVQGSVTEKDIIAAQARQEEARAILARLESGPDKLDVQIAEEELHQAQIDLELRRDTLSAAKTDAQTEMEIAANQLRDAQDAYSQLYWENREDSSLSEPDKDAEEAALRAVDNAERQLAQARRAYELAREEEKTGIALAESNVRSSRLNLEELLAPARSEELAAARAQVANSENELDNLQGERRALELKSANLEVELAQTNLAMLDPTSHRLGAEIAGRNAEFARRKAELRVQQAEINLQRATLMAPTRGTIAQVNIRPGQPSGNVAFVLADFSEWRVEAEGLSELDVTRVEVGDRAIITLDALPGNEMLGTVTRIGTLGEVSSNENVTYDVVITPDEWHSQIRWNMTASVTILPDENSW